MKIISWNCNGGLRKKTHLLDALDADLLIIQECENPAESSKSFKAWSGSYLWKGESKSKGVGIFPRKTNVVRELDWNSSFTIDGLKSKSISLTWKTSDLKLFLPFILNEQFTILACWTKGKPDQVFGYMGQFWKYLQIHRENLARSDTIIIGDFNSNAIWDKSDRWWNHSSTIEELSDMRIESVYHDQNKENHGLESEPTFFHQRNLAKSYHIDYAFVSKDIIDSFHMRIGKPDAWLSNSDHMPIILTHED